MASLRTDYTDAVWSGNKKYLLIENDDGTISLQDVTAYTNKENSFFGASDANSINKAINTLNDIFQKNAGSHNAVYRGKYLGSTVTQAQYDSISAGTFDDLYIGDYWTVNGVNYRIAAFDYYYNTGDTKCDTHHAVLVPDTALYTNVMNSSNVTDKGYAGSAMKTSGLNAAETTINNAFGSDHILSHRNLFTNAVASGKAYATGVSWYDSTVDLMNENNVIGGFVYNNILNGTEMPNSNTLDIGQFPLFAFDHTKIAIGSSYWIRDVSSSKSFVYVNSEGVLNANTSSSTQGVRPAFCIKA